MAVVRMDNVAVVVEDLDAAISFFTALGLALDARASIEGPWADLTVGLTGIRSEIAMMSTPDGGCKLELTWYDSPPAIATTPAQPAPNTVGLHRVMFAVDDIDATVERLKAHGAVLLGDIANYESTYRLCYLRGPAGIIVALAQQLG